MSDSDTGPWRRPVSRSSSHCWRHNCPPGYPRVHGLAQVLRTSRQAHLPTRGTSACGVRHRQQSNALPRIRPRPRAPERRQRRADELAGAGDAPRDDPRARLEGRRAHHRPDMAVDERRRRGRDRLAIGAVDRRRYRGTDRSRAPGQCPDAVARAAAADRRRQRVVAEHGSRDCRGRGVHRCLRAARRGKRHRQGAAGPARARSRSAAAERRLRHPRLRGDHPGALGQRVLRTRARRIYGRRQRAGGRFRAGQRRNAVPRRGRRAAAADPGAAAASRAGAPVQARREQHLAAHRVPAGVRNQPRSAGVRRRRQVSRRPLSPHRGWVCRVPPSTRAAGGHPAADDALPVAAQSRARGHCARLRGGAISPDARLSGQRARFATARDADLVSTRRVRRHHAGRHPEVRPPGAHLLRLSAGRTNSSSARSGTRSIAAPG